MRKGILVVGDGNIGFRAAMISAALSMASPPIVIVDQPQTPKAVHSATARARTAYRRWKNNGTGARRNNVPQRIQDKLIASAKARRAERANKLLWDALTRDSRYYRVIFGSNANRFRKISFLELSNG